MSDLDITRMSVELMVAEQKLLPFDDQQCKNYGGYFYFANNRVNGIARLCCCADVINCIFDTLTYATIDTAIQERSSLNNRYGRRL